VLRIQQEGDRALQDLTATCSPIPWGGRDEIGGTVGRGDRGQLGEEAEHATGAAQGRPASGDAATQHADRDLVLQVHLHVLLRDPAGERPFRRAGWRRQTVRP